jgi:serine O-acetyltransferase
VSGSLIPAGGLGVVRPDLRMRPLIRIGESVSSACVCEGGSLGAAFRDDLKRYESRRAGLLSQGLWATTAYRWSHYARYRLRSRLLGVVPYLLQRVLLALTGIDLDSHAHIGPGLYIPHGGYIVVGPIRAGRDCNFYQGITLGKGLNTLDNPNFKSLLPTLGDGVWVLPGAVIVGDVTVGDDAAISANSLVVRDVPPGGVVMGVPARLVSKRGGSRPGDGREIVKDDERNAASAADAETGPAGRDSHNLGPDHRFAAGAWPAPGATESRQGDRRSP